MRRMVVRRIRPVAAVAGVLCVALALLGCAQQSPLQIASQQSEPAAMLALDHVVGRYVCGDDTFVSWWETLELRSDGTFVRESVSNCDNPPQRQEGIAFIEGNALVLRLSQEPQFPAVALGASFPDFGLVGRFSIMKWGERVYLLMAGQEDYFAMAVNNGQEPRSRRLGGSVYLREGQEQIPVVGKPRIWPPGSKS